MFFDLWRSTTHFALGAFLPDFLTLLLLFFIASAALPDEIPADGLDLETYYFENRTYFWTLFLLLAISTTVSMALHRATAATTVTDVTRWILASGNLTLVILSGVLIATGRRWVHAALILLMLAALVWQWVALTITG